MTETDRISTSSSAAASSVALLGADFPNLRIRPELAEGDLVASGQVVFRDSRRPEIAFVAPVSGRVTAIRHGARRVLQDCVISHAEGAPPPIEGRMAKGQSARDYLLARGMWSAFVARPFGGPPDPGAKCAAILVSAVAGSRFAPDPDQVLADRREAFVRGLATLRELTEGPIHLCLDGATEVGRPEVPDLRLHRHRAGRFWRSASAQVARVCPASPARQVWTIGYQDVIAIGHLMETGRYDSVRRIALRPDGAGVAEMRTVPLGCDLWHMLGVARQQARRVPKSGTALSGRVSDFLGRYHLEAGLEAAPGEAARRFARPLIPLTSLGGVLPVALPVVPLMRSLIAGDAEASARLGCLQLLEEDVAPLASLCTSGTDYPERLRGVLDVLRRDLA